jgi:putative transposase
VLNAIFYLVAQGCSWRDLPFVLVKKRWIVERTFGWWRWSRRLVQDYEQLPENAEAMLQIAMIRIMLRRLA